MSVSSNHISSCPPESLFPPLSPNDGTGHIYFGSAAGLNDLRQYCPDSSKKSVTEPIQENGQIDCAREINLLHLHSAMVTLCFPSKSTVLPPKLFQNIHGQVFVTSRRLFFVTMESADDDFDLAVDSAQISLHAMTSDPEYSVYCQLSCSTYPENVESFIPKQSEHDGSQRSEHAPGEIHISPPKTMTDENKLEFCQGLFQSLSRLASLNPVHSEEDGNGFAAMMNMMAATCGSDIEGEVENRDDMIFRIDSRQGDNLCANTDDQIQGKFPGEATEQERHSMLERLDNVLTVPPEYRSDIDCDDNKGAFGQFDDCDENKGAFGQFDDADENDELI